MTIDGAAGLSAGVGEARTRLGRAAPAHREVLVRLRSASLAIALALALLAQPQARAAQQPAAPGAVSPVPPATPIQDLRSLAGRWEGRVMPRTGGSEPWAWVIHPDGSYDVEPFGTRGVLDLSEGRLRFRNLTTGGRGGTATLHEGGGRRVLRGAMASGDFTFELIAVPAGAPRAAGPRPALAIGLLTSFPVKEPYQAALEELGYVDGKTIALEYRLGPPDRLPELAAELVRLNVSVIFTTATGPALAAKRATATIPIVFVAADPLAAGLVPSLARPGGNLTGVSAVSPEVVAKRLQLLAEAVPSLRRAGILANPTHGAAASQVKELERAARALNLEVRTYEVRTPADVEPAFASMAKEAVGGVVVLTDPVLLQEDFAIVRLAARHRLPLIGESRQYATRGGLMTYGPSYPDLVRRAAGYVDRIVKGARPADLPVEQPTKFELIINAKTARALGLTIPPSLLLRADRVIE